MKVLDEDEEGGGGERGESVSNLNPNPTQFLFEAALTSAAAMAFPWIRDSLPTEAAAGDAKKASLSLPLTSVFLRSALSFRCRSDALIAASAATPDHLSQDEISIKSLSRQAKELHALQHEGMKFLLTG